MENTAEKLRIAMRHLDQKYSDGPAGIYDEDAGQLFLILPSISV